MSQSNQETKKKQYLLISVIMIFIMGAGMIVVASKGNTTSLASTTSPEEEVVIERFSAIGDNVDADEVWRATSSNEIDELKTENQELKQDLRTVSSSIEKQVNEAVAKKTSEIKTQIETEQNRKLEKLQKELEEERKKAERKAEFTEEKKNHVVGRTTPSNQITVTRRAFERTNPQIDNPGLAEYRAPELKQPKPLPKPEPKAALNSITFGVEIIDTERELQNLEKEVVSQVVSELPKHITANEYVPAGSFVRAVMIGGADAPTGGQAEENPVPVLFEIEDVASLPNAHEYDLVSCRVVGAAHGEVSSERAITRLEKLSCVDDKGVIYESFVKGHVYDETGRLGIKGRLVTKQGQMIANSLFAGIGAGIGGAFQNSATNYSTNALGTQTSSFPSASEAVQAGLGQGIASTFDRLSKYFIRLAEQIFPVIEVDAGRIVDLVFTSGFEVKPGVISKAELPEALNGAINVENAQDITIGQLTQGSADAINQAQNIGLPR